MWMVRAFPGQIDQMATFLKENIIAVHWGIGNLTGCTTKSDIANVVAIANLQPRDASLKIGLLDRFVNQMKVGDYCIVPYDNDTFYTAKIKSDYYFDPNSNKYDHQRKVEWLFDGEPFGRDELPKQLQTSLKSQLGLADITQHEPAFFKYLNKKQASDLDDEANENNSLVSHLDSLVEDAINVLKEEIHSDDPNRRLQAAIAIMELNSNRQI